jgi:hypothetical protein
MSLSPRPPADDASAIRFDASVASGFAKVALANIDREYPNQPGHVWQSAADGLSPSALHPAFYGSYDWHSAVHMHWLLARVRRLHPRLPVCATIDAAFDRHFAPAAIAGECAYLDRPLTGGFERTYGWAWLLKLADELSRSEDEQAQRWTAAVEPLARRFVTRYLDYLPRADYPLRHGMHANSAFGLLFALDYGKRRGDMGFTSALQAKARAWFGADRKLPAEWEPSGADFLSPALTEALLMSHVLDNDEFRRWFAASLPGFAAGEPTKLFQPVSVRDRSDLQIVHLDGLNLARAWCFRGLAGVLGNEAGASTRARVAAEGHLQAGMRGLASADYGGAHWLASFATLALTEHDLPELHSA